MAFTTLCQLCQKPAELRPYGPNGESICFDCSQSTPEMQAAAVRQFITRLEAAGNESDVIVLGPDGPKPATIEDVVNQAAQVPDANSVTDVPHMLHKQ